MQEAIAKNKEDKEAAAERLKVLNDQQERWKGDNERLEAYLRKTGIHRGDFSDKIRSQEVVLFLQFVTPPF